MILYVGMKSIGSFSWVPAINSGCDWFIKPSVAF